MSGGEGRVSGGEGRSYHGQPVLKQPVWTWEIPSYFFLGGMAGASAGLAYLSDLRGDDVLAQRAWGTALAALVASPPLLIADLGRPERFVNMLRLFKVTSPMSVGSWVLTLSGPATGLAAVNSFSGRCARGAVTARPVAALAGLPLVTYTAALLANTAVPAWHEARQTLPFVFAAGAALSAGGACAAATPVEHAGGARRLALGAAAAELAATQIMEHRLGLVGEVYRTGGAARYSRISRACILTGGALLARRGATSRAAAVASGALLCAGALATRWSVFKAGSQSVADPRYVVEPQRRRLRERAAAAAPDAAAPEVALDERQQ